MLSGVTFNLETSISTELVDLFEIFADVAPSRTFHLIKETSPGRAYKMYLKGNQGSKPA